MSRFFQSSIGQKLLMSVTGLFLMVFLLVHLFANLFLLAGSDAFNIVVHFMDTNPLIQVMQPVLALGFLVHMIYASILTIQNQKARPQNYDNIELSHSSTWSSRNMFVLGALVAIFLIIHLMNFFWVMKFNAEHGMTEVTIDGVTMHNGYALVAGLFTAETWGVVYSLVYVLGAIFLGLHLRHAFWSAFQTIGLSNKQWRKRLTAIGNISLIIAVGFAIIPIFFLIFGMDN